MAKVGVLMSCRQTAVKGGQRVVANNGRACSARGLPGDEVRLEDEAEHDALAKGKAPVRRELRSSRQGQCSADDRLLCSADGPACSARL